MWHYDCDEKERNKPLPHRPLDSLHQSVLNGLVRNLASNNPLVVDQTVEALKALAKADSLAPFVSCNNPVLSKVASDALRNSPTDGHVVCDGCRRRRSEPCFHADRQFTVAHLPASTSHWESAWGQYVPLLPVAYHKLVKYKSNSSGVKTPTGEYAVFNHSVIGPTLRRDLTSKDFLDATQGRFLTVWLVCTHQTVANRLCSCTVFNRRGFPGTSSRCRLRAGGGPGR